MKKNWIWVYIKYEPEGGGTIFLTCSVEGLDFFHVQRVGWVVICFESLTKFSWPPPTSIKRSLPYPILK